MTKKLTQEDQDLLERAKAVLQQNDRGSYTVPANDLYPHQWLWDSCFIAIGLAHVDTNRAKQEIMHLLQAQWSNGMIPNIVFNQSDTKDSALWDSKVSPKAPVDQATSGITQPPLIAEAVTRIGKQLEPTERRSFYHAVYPKLIAYHEWLYRERDPHQQGLITLVHPWESGMDNSPPWVEAMYANQIPWWIRLINWLPLDGLIDFVRNDTRHIDRHERISTLQALVYYHVLQRLKRKQYDSARILLRSHFAIQDVAFNSILVRANHLLRKIANDIKAEIPEELDNRMTKASAALETLYDATNQHYLSRQLVTGEFLKQASVASLLPLYSDTLTTEHTDAIVQELSSKGYATRYPIPTTPTTSPYFSRERYWQGPTWININWLLIDGLERTGHEKSAQELREATLHLVRKNGFAEYFDPHSGEPRGANNFSWTAALTIDLLSR